MQEEPFFEDCDDRQSKIKRLSFNLDLCSKISYKPSLHLLSSRSGQNKQRMEQQLKDSIHRLQELEEENSKLRDQFWGMKETAEKLMLQKQILVEKLSQKVENVNQLQHYLLEQNQIKTAELAHKIEQYEKQLKIKSQQLQYLRQEYKEELKQKQDQIYQLNQLLEREKSKADQFSKNDFSLNQRLTQLESENFLLEKELADSQISLFDLRKSLASQKIKDIEQNQEMILSQINLGKRIATVETETDTTYAIQTMQEKILRLKETNREEKQKFRFQMQNMRQFYEGQLELIRIELADEDKDRERQKLSYKYLKNKAISISQNIENVENLENVENIMENYVPLKEQIYQVVGRPEGIKLDFAQNKSVFTQKYFSSESFIFKHQIEDVVDQDASEHQYSPEKINLIESRQQSIQSNKNKFNTRSLLLFLSVGALALYATKRYLQSR